MKPVRFNWFFLLPVWLCLAAAMALQAFGLEPYDPETPRFLMSTFLNADQNKLFVAESFDGRYFKPRGGTHAYQTSDGSIIRDPSMILHEGVWYVCHTAGTSLGNADYFRILSSPDLVHWQYVRDVSMAAIPGTRYTWAPEWFRDDDGSLHVLVSVSPWVTNEHVIYEIHPLDNANTAGDWSAPQRLTGDAFPWFIPSADGSQRVGAYDPYVVKINGVYNLGYFNRPTSSLAHATAPSLLGPYTADATVNIYGTGTWKEGETMTHLGGAIWRFTYANAITSKLYFVESSDDWVTWSVPQEIGSPAGVTFNHGTALYNPDAPVFQSEISAEGDGGLSVRFPSLKENFYQLEFSSDLSGWEAVGDVISGDGQPTELLLPPVSGPAIFFRVRWLPLQ